MAALRQQESANDGQISDVVEKATKDYKYHLLHEGDMLSIFAGYLMLVSMLIRGRTSTKTAKHL